MADPDPYILSSDPLYKCKYLKHWEMRGDKCNRERLTCGFESGFNGCGEVFGEAGFMEAAQ